MPPFARSILAVVAGVVVAGLIVFLVEWINSQAFPLPAGTDFSNPESIAKAIAAMPVAAMLLVLFGWFLGTAVGAFVAARLAPGLALRHGMTVGVVQLVAGVMNMASFTHPLWFWIVGVLVFLPAAYLGVRVYQGQRNASDGDEGGEGRSTMAA